MTVKLYPPFSAYAGVRECEVVVPEGTNVAGVLRRLCEDYPRLPPHLGHLEQDQLFRRHALVLLDDDVADLSSPVHSMARLALVGPLQGG